MASLTYFIVLIAAVGTCVNSQFSNPGGNYPSWPIDTTQNAVWDTTSTSDTYIHVFGNDGSGFVLNSRDPVTSPFQFLVESYIDVSNNPWHFELLYTSTYDPTSVLFKSDNFEVVSASAASIITPQSAAPTMNFETATPTSLPSSTTAASLSVTVGSSTSTTPASLSVSPTSSTVSTAATAVSSSSGLPHSTVVGIGAGLGIGIPLLIIAVLITTILMRRRSTKAEENSAYGIQYAEDTRTEDNSAYGIQYVDETAKSPERGT